MPAKTPEEYKPFHNRHQELSIEGHCLFWGNRVVVPEKLRSRFVEELKPEPPRNHTNKVSCLKLFVVAGIRQHVRKVCTELFALSVCTECPSCRSATSLAVALSSMAAYTPRFCGSLLGANVHDCCRRPFQVAGNSGNEKYISQA